MLLFLLQVTKQPGSLKVEALRESLLRAAAPFQQLDESTLVSAVSESGCLAFAAVGQLPERVAPRNYVAMREDAIAAFDGMPLDPRGEFCAYDANALLERWADCDRLDGQFTAVRADLRTDTFQCLTDVLSMHPIYSERSGDGYLVGNSVEAIRGVSGASDLDSLGVSTWLALGWAAGYRTLLSSITAAAAGLEGRVQRGRDEDAPQRGHALARGPDERPQGRARGDRRDGAGDDRAHALRHRQRDAREVRGHGGPRQPHRARAMHRGGRASAHRHDRAAGRRGRDHRPPGR